jgi:hypothetical protein
LGSLDPGSNPGSPTNILLKAVWFWLFVDLELAEGSLVAVLKSLGRPNMAVERAHQASFVTGCFKTISDGAAKRANYSAAGQPTS